MVLSGAREGPGFLLRIYGSHPTVQKKGSLSTSFLGAQWDSNPRHSEPQSDALTN